MDYVAAATNNHAFCLAVEKLLGVEIPRRAAVDPRDPRRAAAALLAPRLARRRSGIDLGAVTPFWYAFREREQILDFFEEYCGARLTLNCMRIGGLPFDLTPGWTERVSEFVDDFPARIDDYEQLLTDNRIWKKRTVGVGVISAEECIEWGLTGPMLRGSGLEWDLRRAQPYECYDELDFVVPTRRERRHLRPVPRARRRRCASSADHPAVPATARAGRDPRQGPARDQAARRGDVRLDRVARRASSASTASPTAPNKPYRLHVRPPSLHQPAGAAAAGAAGTWSRISSP